MRRAVLVALAGLVIAIAAGGAGAAYVLLAGPDMTPYERFRDPSLVSLPTQRVLVVEVTGNPDMASGQAMSALYDIYFKMDGVPRGFHPPAPIARWPKGLTAPQDEWVGRFALPVPDSVQTIPTDLATKYPTAHIERWEYGDVAQILHVGPYTSEAPSIARLHEFIESRGYAIAGEHEEEYLRGPGMFGPNDPERYYTLIRYAVRRADP